jgi:molybdopterin synthase sulfur carrier subunit
MSVKIRYFAWLREKTGVSEETVTLPAGVATIADLIAWLARRGPEFQDAFARPEAVRAAIDQVHAKPMTRLAGAREIAFFPPVTGG